MSPRPSSPAPRSACSAAASSAACSRSPPAGWAIASTCFRRTTTRPPAQVADVEVDGVVRRSRRGRARSRAASTSSRSSSRTSRPPRRRRRREFAPVRPVGPRAAHRRSIGCARSGSSRARASRSTPFARVAHAADLERGAGATSACPRCSRPRAWATTARARRRSSDADEAARRVDDARAAPRRSSKRFVDFECEVSVVAARGADGAMVAASAPIENAHAQPHSRRLACCRRAVSPATTRATPSRSPAACSRRSTSSACCASSSS